MPRPGGREKSAPPPLYMYVSLICNCISIDSGGRQERAEEGEEDHQYE